MTFTSEAVARVRLMNGDPRLSLEHAIQAQLELDHVTARRVMRTAGVCAGTALVALSERELDRLTAAYEQVKQEET